MKISRCAVVILEDDLDNIQLYLRDNKPNIPFPNAWALLGGLLKHGENPDEGIKRELREELELLDGSLYELHNLDFLFVYQRRDITREEYVYRAQMREKSDDLVLIEGQKLGLFDQLKIEKLKRIVPHHKEILARYIRMKSDEKKGIVELDG